MGEAVGIVERANGGELTGKEVAERFDLLLQTFLRADGEPWKNAEIEEATGGRVTSSYVSALRGGKFKRPGIKQLEDIAAVVGFPFELWRTEPEFWDEVLEKHPPRGSIRSLPPSQSVPRVPCGETLAGLVGRLFARKRNPATGETYTEEEVAAKSRGRLTAEEVRRMRSGGQVGPPPEIELIALADVFGVSPRYWHEEDWCLSSDPSEQVNRELAMTCTFEALDRNQQNAVLALARLMLDDRPIHGGRSGADSEVSNDGARGEGVGEFAPEDRANGDAPGLGKGEG